jgi:recombination protein RecA
VKVVKNKVAAPFTEAEFDILYSCGISREGSVIDAAVVRGVVERRGSWLAFGTEQLGQGTLAAIEYLKEHAEVMERIIEAVKATPLLPAALKGRKPAA